MIRKLAENKVYIKLFVASEKKFSPEWTNQFNIFIINTISPLIYSALVSETDEVPEIDAEEIRIPEESVHQLKVHQEQAKAELADVENELTALSVNKIEAVEHYLLEIEQSIDLHKVIGNTKTAVDDHVKIVEAYAPVDETKALEEYLDKNEIAWITEKADPADRIPIKQKNNRFARLYEPVGKLFSLPSYTEMDLTPFFAPFFMMFFGFCLGDLGYGLVIVAGAAWYKRKAKEDIKPILSLAQFLGIGTIILGTLTGSFFGISLVEIESLKKFTGWMLDSQKVFYLSLAVGMFQIMFGMALKAVNNYRLFGWQYAMLPVGWLILLFGIIDVALLKMMPGINMFIIYAGIGVIILFSDPASGIFGRIGKGIWELYGISGIFGDVLSYVRLFALGISGAILGFVVNTIALQIKDSAPVIGPIFFVIFLIVGHGANLLISSLGAFVHPMRLTFVEFYKNAGFEGGGKEYTPFRNKLIN
jgi:V/A-type H+-transporting ATPase subunit I